MSLPKAHLNDPRFLALVSAASSSPRDFFALIQSQTLLFPDHAEQLVRKARVVLAFRIDEDENEEHVVDLKTGPLPVITTQVIDEKSSYDVIISVDTKLRFVKLMKQEEDGLEAYRVGAVRVKGSMRALLKLRGLQELGERWKEDFAVPSLDQTVISPDGSEDEHSHAGYLDKQSEWLKRWNNRYVVLKWNERTRPQLRIFNSQAASRQSAIPSRAFLELHSSMQVLASADDPLAFSLVDARAQDHVLFVFRASSERSVNEWKKALESAITARTRALEQARLHLTNAGEAMIGGKLPNNTPASLLDVLLATQKVCSTHTEQLRVADESRRAAQENLQKLEARALEADQFLIYSTIESDFTTLRKHFSWKSVPMASALVWLASKAVFSSTNLLTSASQSLGTMIVTRIINAGLPFISDALHEKVQLQSSRAGAIVVLVVFTLFVRRVTESKNFDLFRRRWRVNALAVSTIWRMKLSMMKAESLPPMHQDALWGVEFRLAAERLYLLSLELRGLWVKSAQFLGARPDVVPEAALQVLRRLHDAVPATPFSEVKTLVEADLNAPLTELFATFDQDVLASASIGQVHCATLKDGSRVVVKVQHPGIGPKIEQDLENMRQIIGWIEMIEPDMEIRPVVEEWSREVGKELDFTLESTNMIDVGRNLAGDDSVYAALPTPIPGMCTKRVFVMRFVPGAKVNDLDNLRRVSGVDTEVQRSNLALDICNAFARQLFVDGIFQADPHPGNILVAARASLDEGALQHFPAAPLDDPNRAIPILLDFGLTKRLPNNKRLAFSRLICAMQNLDVSQLLLSFDEMGLRLKREDPFEDLSEFRFAFRETDSADKSRAETMAHIKKAQAKYENLPRSERNPVEAFPTELMLFFRTIFLLRGLCTSLNVRVKYLKTMGVWAKRAMQEKYDHVIVPEVSGDKPKETELETRLRFILKEASEAHGHKFLGIQVFAMNSKDGNVLANLNLGRKHELDPRPVKFETLFPVLSLAQSVAQIAAMSFFEVNGVPLKSKVKDVWPEFGDDVLTIEGLISGDATLLPYSPSTVYPKFSVGSMHKWQDHVAFVEQLSKDTAGRRGGEIVQNLPFELSALSFAWGWTLVGLMQRVAKNKEECAFENAVTSSLGSKVGGTFFGRAPTVDTSLSPPKKGTPPAEEQEIELKRTAHRDIVESKYAVISVDVDKISGGAVDLDKMWDVQSEFGQGGPGAAPGGFDIGAVLKSLGPSFKGKEYFVDPRIMNVPSARSSVSPNCNLLTNAAALAKLFAALGNGGIVPGAGGERVVQESVARFFAEEFSSKQPSPSNEPCGETLGMKVFEFRASSAHAQDTSVVMRGFGQVAFGGSLVICIPQVNLSLAVLVNDVTLDREVTRIAVDEVLRHVGLTLLSEV